MREPRQNQRFTPEALAGRSVSDAAVQQQLDGDVAIQIVVVRLPHFSHSAFANSLEQAIAAEYGAGLNRDGCGGSTSSVHDQYTSRSRPMTK